MEFPLDVHYMHSENGPMVNIGADTSVTPKATANLREKNEYFRVDEILGFDLSGEGEHLYLQIRKNGQNTAWVKEQLASQLGMHPRDIGHSGLKDRHAITSQWLSIYAPKSEPELEKVQIDGVQILQSSRHRLKLKPGMHESNYFEIRLTEFLGNKETTEYILTKIKKVGFPNYFGEQRFGRDGGNLPKAWQLIKQRRLNKHKKKSIYLSSLRSFLFNRVLDARVEANMSTDSPDLSLTGPLWGRGRLNIDQEQAGFEYKILHPWKELCEALEFSGLQQERRSLFVILESLNWNWLEADQLELSFHLPSGSYATSALREIANITDLALARTQI